MDKLIEVVIEGLVKDSPVSKQQYLERILHSLVNDAQFELLHDKYMWERSVDK